MKWFMKLSIGFLVLAVILLSFVYFLTPPRSTEPFRSLEEDTESTTTSPSATQPERRPHK